MSKSKDGEYSRSHNNARRLHEYNFSNQYDALDNEKMKEDN